jgi:3-hydroxyacyl-CoA dehydrogenase
MPWSVPNNYKSRPVVVLGGGVLGRRIAACWVSAGWHVRVRDPSEKSRNDAVAYVEENIDTYLALTHGKKGDCDAFADLEAAVEDAWLVFEAVPEILSLKEDTFLDLEKFAPDDCILASNSSSYKSSELLSEVTQSTKERVLNTHYMMPPKVRRSRSVFPYHTYR